MFIDKETYEKKKRSVETHHPCTSCDSIEPIAEADNCGRCKRCQEEYPFGE